MQRATISRMTAWALACSAAACGGSAFTQSGGDGGESALDGAASGSGSGAGSSSAGSSAGSSASSGASTSSGGHTSSASSTGGGSSGSNSGSASGGGTSSSGSSGTSSAGSSSGAASSGSGSSGGVDGGVAPPPSCSATGPGLSSCGPGGGTSCCASLEVPEGMFYRSYDGVSYASEAYPATVGPFRLDRYEVTVGRFRQFVAASAGGYVPPAGSGKHTHVNAGNGLLDTGSTVAGVYETGWLAAWNTNLATTASGWNTNLACSGSPTWTSTASTSENRPINCLTWFEAYAFCIWDGGFLPSEAEWNYAAAGGSDQRAYPWSVPSTTATIDCSHANYAGCTSAGYAADNVGSQSPTGDGRWGHADLAGNAWEWVLDWDTTYVVPCANCGYLTLGAGATGSRVIRGGGFAAIATSELASFRGSNGPTNRYSGYVGVRCARTP